MTNEGIGLKANQVLSDLDKAYVVITYPRATPHPEAPEWTFDHALDIAKVDDIKDRAKLKELLEGNKIDELRKAFNQINALKNAMNP